jgi:hypothetical protein
MKPQMDIVSYILLKFDNVYYYVDEMNFRPFIRHILCFAESSFIDRAPVSLINCRVRSWKREVHDTVEYALSNDTYKKRIKLIVFHES